METYPNGRESKHKIDQSKSEGSQQRFFFRKAGLREDGGWVEGNDVDSTPEEKSFSGESDHMTSTYICWAIMTTKEARVARRTRGIVKSSMNRET